MALAKLKVVWASLSFLNELHREKEESMKDHFSTQMGNFLQLSEVEKPFCFPSKTKCVMLCVNIDDFLLAYIRYFYLL